MPQLYSEEAFISMAETNGKSVRPAPRVVHTRAEVRAAVRAAQAAGGKVGVVPTMGALHAGHMSLVEASCAECDFTVVTIFVNPTQFGPNEDFSKYPRTLPADLQLLSRQKVDLVFAPAADEMYAKDHETFVEVGPVGTPLEGACRPVHFRGVATVVLKLLQAVPAEIAYFGRKDYQQTQVIRRMATDFDLFTEIRVLPTVREADGLAMSSRNAYLSADERRRALALWEALQLAERLVASGTRDIATIRQQMIEHLETAGRAEIDYVALVRDGTVAEVTAIDGQTVALIAAKIGATRLIDNMLIGKSEVPNDE
jgi:pantoate--beta-alanine ligase